MQRDTPPPSPPYSPLMPPLSPGFFEATRRPPPPRSPSPSPSPPVPPLSPGFFEATTRRPPPPPGLYADEPPLPPTPEQPRGGPTRLSFDWERDLPPPFVDLPSAPRTRRRSRQRSDWAPPSLELELGTAGGEGIESLDIDDIMALVDGLPSPDPELFPPLSAEPSTTTTTTAFDDPGASITRPSWPPPTPRALVTPLGAIRPARQNPRPASVAPRIVPAPTPYPPRLAERLELSQTDLEAVMAAESARLAMLATAVVARADAIRADLRDLQGSMERRIAETTQLWIEQGDPRAAGPETTHLPDADDKEQLRVDVGRWAWRVRGLYEMLTSHGLDLEGFKEASLLLSKLVMAWVLRIDAPLPAYNSANALLVFQYMQRGLSLVGLLQQGPYTGRADAPESVFRDPAVTVTTELGPAPSALEFAQPTLASDDALVSATISTLATVAYRLGAYSSEDTDFVTLLLNLRRHLGILQLDPRFSSDQRGGRIKQIAHLLAFEQRSPGPRFARPVNVHRREMDRAARVRQGDLLGAWTAYLRGVVALDMYLRRAAQWYIDNVGDTARLLGDFPTEVQDRISASLGLLSAVDEALGARTESLPRNPRADLLQFLSTLTPERRRAGPAVGLVMTIAYTQDELLVRGYQPADLLRAIGIMLDAFRGTMT